MKKFLIKAFNKPKDPVFRRVNNFYALLTIISIVSLVLETVASLSKYETTFFIIEWTAVVLFTFEYLARVYLSKPSWKYMVSFFGLVDLVAILPTFVGLGNFTFLKSARALRIIRLLRIMRLAKLGKNDLVSEEKFGVMSLNIVIYFSILVLALLITGTAMYLVEPDIFASIPVGMWWSFKVFLASIPVVQPETGLGEIFYVLTRFVGLMLLGLLVGVVGNIFRTLVLGKNG